MYNSSSRQSWIIPTVNPSEYVHTQHQASLAVSETMSKASVKEFNYNLAMLVMIQVAHNIERNICPKSR